MVCPKCDSWIPDGARRCPSCNELLRKKIEPVVEEVIEEEVVKKKKTPARTKEKREAVKPEEPKTNAEPARKRVETLHLKSTDGQTKPPFESIVVTMETPQKKTEAPQKTPVSPVQNVRQESVSNNVPKSIGTASNNTNKTNTFANTSTFNTSNYTGTGNSNYTSQSYTPPSRSSYLKGVNKVIYCILVLFLGTLGIHKFYAKKHLAGVVYIVLSICSLVPLTAFLSLIDLVVALLKPADAYGNIYF